MLEVTGRTHPLTRLWADALTGVVVRHLNPVLTPMLTLEDSPEPMLHIEIDKNPDSRDPAVMFEPFRVTNVRLAFFPGETLARKWLAVAWAGFMFHEALELVTSADFRDRVVDPHESPELLEWNFHRAFPRRLTRESMIETLATAIPPDQLMLAMHEVAA